MGGGDPIRAKPPRVDGTRQGLDHPSLPCWFVAAEEKVDAGIDRPDGRFTQVATEFGKICDRGHLKIVGDDDSVESQGLAEQAVDRRSAHGGGDARIERFEDHVRGHDRRHVRLDDRSEGW